MSICPYCLCPIEETDEKLRCAACGAEHHAECLRENGGCAVRDCSNEPRPNPIEIEVDAEPHTMLVLSRESIEQVRSSPARRESNPCMQCGKQLPEGELYCRACTPEVSENQDARNTGPLVTMGVIALVALAAVWMATSMPGCGSEPSSTRVGPEQSTQRAR